MKIAIQSFRQQDWFDGDIHGVIDLVRRAEALGVHQVEVADHILMGEDHSGYPYGKPKSPPDYDWYEPVSLLSAIAMVTERIRLSTGVLIAPLRPAPLLAKQLATLDRLSRGRVDIGLGVGWQKLEYDASGIPWERRFTRLMDQVRVCKAFWSQCPASHHGAVHDFDRAYMRPAPVQPGGVPIWFGFGLSDVNLERIAELGDGWIPAERRPAILAEQIARIKEAMAARGRDPDAFQVRVALGPKPGDDDPRRAFDRIADYERAGVTVLAIQSHDYCTRADQLDDLFRDAVAAAG